MKLSQWVKRAHKEIERCHIAVRRLYTAIHNKNDSFRKSLSRLQTRDPLIHGAVCDFVARRQRVNGLLLSRLDTLTNSSNYSGDCSCGVRLGSDPPSSEGTDNAGQPLVVIDKDGKDGDNDEELGADETDELVGQLIDYVSDPTLLSWTHWIDLHFDSQQYILCV